MLLSGVLFSIFNTKNTIRKERAIGVLERCSTKGQTGNQRAIVGKDTVGLFFLIIMKYFKQAEKDAE